jgi:hypothetical protein
MLWWFMRWCSEMGEGCLQPVRQSPKYVTVHSNVVVTAEMGYVYSLAQIKSMDKTSKTVHSFVFPRYIKRASRVK